MAKIHQKLHLQHHRHTGKLLHHRHTSYRGLAVVLGLAAVFMAGLNLMARVTADSLYVYATVPAPIPTDPAIITSPADGTIGQSNPVVRGTCPVIIPRVIIVIEVDGISQGSVACDSNNNFALPIFITRGPHTIIAKTYTITGDSGPDSAPRYIVYVIPTTSIIPASGNLGQSGTVTPLVVTLDEPFIIFGPSKDAVWMGTISGGRLPYRVHVNWGDNSFNDYTINTSGPLQVQHHYKKMQPYDIRFSVTDPDGRRIDRHFAAVTPYIPPSGNLLSTSPGSVWPGQGLIGVYGLYLMLLALFGWLWVHNHKFAYAPVRTAKGRAPFNQRYNRSYAAAKPKRRTPPGNSR